jgi:hypothetical protein
MSHNKSNSKGKVPTELKVMEKLTLVEQFLSKLKIDFDSCGFRRNRVVDDGITRGLQEIDDAVEHLANEDFQKADVACRVAWLHAHFARGIFDAETTEHYLGEGIFLELGDELVTKDWRKFAAEELADLQEDIVKLRKEIKEESNRK